MIKRPLLFHHNAAYRGPKNKNKINAALNSIKIDTENLSKYALYISAKTIATLRYFLFTEQLEDQYKTSDTLVLSMVINNNVEIISDGEITSTRDIKMQISEYNSQIEFMRNNVNRKYVE